MTTYTREQKREVALEDEIDALRAKLDKSESAIMEYWRTGNTEKLQQLGCEIKNKILEEK